MTETSSDARVAPSPPPGRPDRPDRPAIELVHLRKEFGDVVAVDDVDLTIGQGEFFSMLGPSGSGKTTVLRMIAGFEVPTAGAVLLGGREVSHLAAYDRDVNTVFQDYALFPHMDVRENVEYGLRVKRVGKAERRRRALEALASVRLQDLAARRPASSPAASASGWRWPARSSTGPRCCSSTSRSAPSTSSCARRCRSS